MFGFPLYHENATCLEEKLRLFFVCLFLERNSVYNWPKITNLCYERFDLSLVLTVSTSSDPMISPP